MSSAATSELGGSSDELASRLVSGSRPDRKSSFIKGGGQTPSFRKRYGISPPPEIKEWAFIGRVGEDLNWLVTSIDPAMSQFRPRDERGLLLLSWVQDKRSGNKFIFAVSWRKFTLRYTGPSRWKGVRDEEENPRDGQIARGDHGRSAAAVRCDRKQGRPPHGAYRNRSRHRRPGGAFVHAERYH